MSEEFYKADLNHDFQEFKSLAKRVTEDLKKMTEMQHNMRWQFGDPDWWKDFTNVIDSSANGWISSSNC